MFSTQGEKGEPGLLLSEDGTVITGPTGPRGYKVNFGSLMSNLDRILILKCKKDVEYSVCRVMPVCLELLEFR